MYIQLSYSTGGKRVTSTEEIKAIQWSTWTSVLGVEVNGIWPKYSQVNDVNAADAVFAHRVIATGDDFGLVKLFRFPSIKKGKCYMSNSGKYNIHVHACICWCNCAYLKVTIV